MQPFTTAGPIADYLAAIHRELRWRPFLRRRAIVEIADHLEESVRLGMLSGLTGAEAAAAAIERFGTAAAVAQRLLDADPIAARATAIAATCTFITGLGWIAVTILVDGLATPVLVLAIVALACAGLSGVSAMGRARTPALTIALWFVSAPAVALGVVHLVSESWRTSGSMSAVAALTLWAGLAVNGIASMLYTLSPAPAVAEER
jgi:hypothetical protein